MIDIGCGDGLYAKILFAEKLDTGIDPDPHELERARALGAYHELIQCHGASVPKSDGTYRTIFSNSVLEHIPDLAPVRKEAHRLPASGRRFFFTVPSPNFERFTAINLMLEALGLMALSRRFRAFFNRFWMHYHAYPLEAWVARQGGGLRGDRGLHLRSEAHLPAQRGAHAVRAAEQSR